MARSTGLLRIVAHHRSFLTAVERLHRRIDVENPALAQKRLQAMVEMSPHPRRTRLLLDRREGAPHRVLADDFPHAEKLGQDPVAAQRRDVRIALVSSQHRQHRRAQNVAGLGRIRALVVQRTIGDERIEQTRSLQKVDEERQLTQRRESRRVIPFDPHRTGETVDHQRLRPRRRDSKRNRRLFTCRVNGDGR